MLKVDARLGGTLSLIPNFLQLSDITLSVQFQRRGFEFQTNGSARIGDVNLYMSVSRHSGITEASAHVPVFSLSSLISGFGTSFIPAGDDLAGTLQQSKFASFSVHKADFEIKKTATGSWLSARGTAVIPGLKNTAMSLLGLNLGSRNRKIALTVEFAGARLSETVNSLSGLDISDIPSFGQLSMPKMVVIIANSNITRPTEFQFPSEAANKFPTTKGAAVHFQRIVAAGKTSVMKMRLKPTDFDIQLANSVTLQEIIGAIIPPMEDTPMFGLLPDIVPGVFTSPVTRLMYNKTQGRFLVQGSVGAANLIPNLLSLEDGVFSGEIITTKTKASRGTASTSKHQYQLSVDGIAVLAGLRLAMKIAYQQKSGSFSIRITSPTDRIELSKMFDTISPLGISNPIVNTLGLDRIVINKPLFQVSHKTRSTAFRVSGSPSIPVFGNFGMELVANSRPKTLIVSFSKSDTSLLGFLNSLTGIDLSGVPFLTMFSGPSAIGVAISPQEFRVLPERFNTYPLSELTQLQSGLGALIKFGLPAKEVCSRDHFCNFFQTILGDHKVTFRITGVTGPKMTFSYRIPAEISIAGWKMYNADLGVKLGLGPPAVGLTNIEMDVPVDVDQTLHFRGALTIDAAVNADARLEVNGIWEHPFRIPFLSIGNILGRLEINVPCVICPVSFAIGGEIAIGQQCFGGNEANCIKAQGYVSVSADDPEDNFLYFRLNQFNYPKMLQAMGIPGLSAISSVSYVTAKDVVVSFTRKDRVLPSGYGTTPVPAGLQMRGTMNLLGMSDLHFNLKVELLHGSVVKSINATVAIGKLDLGPGGLVTLSSFSSATAGPVCVLEAVVLPKPTFIFRLDGMLRIPILSAEASAYVIIDDKGIFAHTQHTHLLGHYVDLKLRAEFESVARPQSFKGFHLEGRFRALGQDVMKGVRERLFDAQRGLNSALDAAVGAFRQAEQVLNNAINHEGAMISAREARQAEFDRANQALQSARDHVDNVCHYKNCNGRKTIPTPCIKQKCTCPRYPCCGGWPPSCSWCCNTVCVPYTSTCGTHTIPWVDPVCTAHNVACGTMKETAQLAVGAAQGTVRTAGDALDEATRAMESAMAEVARLRPLSTAAEGAASAARAAVNSIAGAINGFFNSFHINSVTFAASLDSTSKGFIAIDLDITVAGTRHRFRPTVNLRDLSSVISEAARRMYPAFIK